MDELHLHMVLWHHQNALLDIQRQLLIVGANLPAEKTEKFGELVEECLDNLESAKRRMLSLSGDGASNDA
jgi:cob(I)alamin adenosyltransferase